MSEPTGHIKVLSNGNLVFVGKRPDDSCYYLAFRNGESRDTYLRFSPEAVEAVIELLGRQDAGEFTFPHQKEWRQVSGLGLEVEEDE